MLPKELCSHCNELGCATCQYDEGLNRIARSTEVAMNAVKATGQHNTTQAPETTETPVITIEEALKKIEDSANTALSSLVDKARTWGCPNVPKDLWFPHFPAEANLSRIVFPAIIPVWAYNPTSEIFAITVVVRSPFAGLPYGTRPHGVTSAGQVTKSYESTTVTVFYP